MFGLEVSAGQQRRGVRECLSLRSLFFVSSNTLFVFPVSAKRGFPMIADFISLVALLAVSIDATCFAGQNLPFLCLEQ